MPTSCWLKHLCSIRAWVPVSFFLSFSLSFRLIPWSTEARWAHFLAQASKTLWRRRTLPSPTREGAQCLRAAVWALRTEFYWLSTSTRGYQPLSLSYFLIVGSGPPGSSPLKDQQVAFPFSRASSQPCDRTQVSRIAGRFFTSWVTGKLRILEWASYPFSRGPSQPRNQIRVSCNCRQILYQLSYQEAQVKFIGWKGKKNKKRG